MSFELKRYNNVYHFLTLTECKGVFALVTKELNKKEKLYAFMLADDDVEKGDLLTILSKHISTTTCRADFVSENRHSSTEEIMH